MIGSKKVSRDSVFKAIEEFNYLGRDTFLKKYSFRRARKYYLLYQNKTYDSKAIWGVAYKFAHPDSGPLKSEEFSGGEKTVKIALERLGFTVISGQYKIQDHDEIALVLVENEVTYEGRYDFWEDDTGVKYQFPNQYKKRVVSGRFFVYYRGVRRAEGKRGIPEYFGCGQIGEVWRDPAISQETPKRRWRWFCSIENYIPFSNPVPAKEDGKTYENISSPMAWRTGVREISFSVLNQILLRAGINQLETSDFPKIIEMPDILDTQIETINNPHDLILKRGNVEKSGSIISIRHSSRRAKQIGDRAEELVYRWLKQNSSYARADSVTWLARIGETPGWDIGYTNIDGDDIAVEVKGTDLARFSSIEMTKNEWEAARNLNERYVIALVVSVSSKYPKISLLWNPFGEYQSGKLSVESTGWRLSMHEDNSHTNTGTNALKQD